MRAWYMTRYGTVEDLVGGDLPVPAAAAGEVLVRIAGSAANPADHKVVRGKDGGRFLHAARFPLVPGYDFCGEVAATGAGVEHWRAGDRVYGHLPYSRGNRQGSFAEYVAVPAESVGRQPAALAAPAAAAAATVGLTAMQMLWDKGDLQPGQNVLVNGASGGVGSMAVQLAKRGGARVTGTCSAGNMGFVDSLGADRVVDYRATAPEALGDSFDVVIDAAAASSYQRCRPVLAPAGSYVTTLPGPALIGGILLSLVSPRSAGVVVVKSRRNDLDQLADWIDAGDVRVPVAHTYGFRDVPEAIAHMQRGGIRGKLAVAGPAV